MLAWHHSQGDIAEIHASVEALKARGIKTEDDIQAVSGVLHDRQLHEVA